jgi:serine/threonine protein phosphatase 1
MAFYSILELVKSEKITDLPGKLWVISDIHACYQSFVQLVDSLELQTTDTLILLGDYLHRGPNSIGVLNQLISWKNQADFRLHLLKGNHDAIFLHMINTNNYDMLPYKLWDIHLIQCLDHKGKLKPEYQELFDSMLHYIETPLAYLVHAAFDIYDETPFLNAESMLWNREPEYHAEAFGGKYIIHGHTPTSLSDIMQSIEKRAKIIDIDNGCAFREKEGLGGLLALELTQWQVKHQPYIG